MVFRRLSLQTHVNVDASAEYGPLSIDHQIADPKRI